jgi:predicted dienelactone hydrolase
MSFANTSRKMLPSLHHDYIRRHRTMRRLTNVCLVAILSAAAAYLITRQPDGGFSVSGSRQPAKSSSTSPELAPPLPRVGSADASAGYNEPAGPYTVAEVSDIVLHDTKRDKDLHLRIFYPERSGKYPVIVFSHGAGGSQTCCDTLTRHWASYGYVTLQPTHDDSVHQRRATGTDDVRFMQAVREALKTPLLWESRPLDISFLLDSLPELEKQVPQLAGKLDVERIGVSGHSMGSYTSEAIAGAAVDLPGRPAANLADPRAKAILCLSPQGPGQFGLTEHSFDGVTVPYLGITGTLDSLGPIASPAWHKIPFDRSQPGDKYEVLIQGANHMSFITAQTLLPGRTAQAQSMLEYTNSAALAFWDTYLKNESAARRYLQSDALEASSHGAAKVDRR